MRERRLAAAAFLIAGSALAFACTAGGDRPASVDAAGPQLGRPAPAALIRRMDLTVAADGSGLPDGAGSVADGRLTFAAKCASCHGEGGIGGAADALVGGQGTLTSPKPIRTVGSYWPYAPTLFDYIRRAMPLSAPQSLEDREVYGLVAYLLSINGIVADTATLDRASLLRIRMPNRDGFASLERQDFDGNIERVAPAKAKGD